MPAVRVAALLGPDALVQRLNDFGLALPEPGGFYGHALALGGADVTLLALSNAPPRGRCRRGAPGQPHPG